MKGTYKRPSPARPGTTKHESRERRPLSQGLSYKLPSPAQPGTTKDESCGQRSLSYELSYKIFHGGFGLAVLVIAVLLAGCSSKHEPKSSGVLLSCGRQVVTVSQYRQLFDTVIAEDFPPGKLPDKQFLQQIHLRLLQQLNDELVIRAYAADVGISVSDEELEKEVARVKSDFPEGEFEHALLENAVAFDFWKERFKTRMLMEKVIARQLESQVEITPRDVAEYYRKYMQDRQPEARRKAADNLSGVDQKVIRHLRRQKAETVYKQWLEHIHKRYQVKLDQDVWHRLLKELNS